jgi:hypothetical protein
VRRDPERRCGPAHRWRTPSVASDEALGQEELDEGVAEGFAEYMDEQLLLTLPHRQFVFSIPKALRIFFRCDQKLFDKMPLFL